MKRILSNTLIVLMATLAMISCKESETVDPTVTISDQTVTLTQKDTYQLEAKLSDYSHDYVVWASNNSEVASVDQEGLVTAKAPGTAEITAKCEYGKNRQTCTVTVLPIYVTAIALDKTTVNKKEGETETLNVTFTPSDATYQSVTWTTSDAEVATVKDGVVSCIGAGTATITATTVQGATSGAALTATCTVNVKSSGNFVKWMDDKAGSKTFITEPASDPATSTSGAISYDGTKISWTANETGAPRIDSLNLSSGAKIVITQFEEKDVAGSYTFISKVFNKGGVWPAKDPTLIDVTFSIESAAVGLQDADGSTHINDINISGIYGSMILPAAFEFDYDAKTAKLGLFLDARDGQGQAIENSYYIFTPGLCTLSASAWGGKYVFNEVELGTPDYTWWWFDFDIENGTFMRKNRTNGSGIPMQELTQYNTTSTTAKYISSIDVVKSDSNVFDHTTVVPDYSANGGYMNVFQINPTGYSGICFERKTN